MQVLKTCSAGCSVLIGKVRAINVCVVALCVAAGTVAQSALAAAASSPPPNQTLPPVHVTFPTQQETCTRMSSHRTFTEAERKAFNPEDRAEIVAEGLHKNLLAQGKQDCAK